MFTESRQSNSGLQRVYTDHLESKGLQRVYTEYFGVYRESTQSLYRVYAEQYRVYTADSASTESNAAKNGKKILKKSFFYKFDALFLTTFFLPFHSIISNSLHLKMFPLYRQHFISQQHSASDRFRTSNLEVMSLPCSHYAKWPVLIRW